MRCFAYVFKASVCRVYNFGQKLAEGSPQEVINDPLVVQAYLGDPDMAKKLQRER
jgi:branched-chain amino acid transport system ATP-binding protein